MRVLRFSSQFLFSLASFKTTGAQSYFLFPQKPMHLWAIKFNGYSLSVKRYILSVKMYEPHENSSHVGRGYFFVFGRFLFCYEASFFQHVRDVNVFVLLYFLILYHKPYWNRVPQFCRDCFCFHCVCHFLFLPFKILFFIALLCVPQLTLDMLIKQAFFINFFA